MTPDDKLTPSQRAVKSLWPTDEDFKNSWPKVDEKVLENWFSYSLEKGWIVRGNG